MHPILGTTGAAIADIGGTPSDVAMRIPSACTIQGFNVYTDGSSGYSKRTITLFYGATPGALAATGISCSLTSPSTSCSSSNAISVAAGGYILLEEVALENPSTVRWYANYSCQ